MTGLGERSTPSGRLPRTSFLVLTRNEERNIAACLQSIFSQEGVDREVILIDSSSTDRTVELARSFPLARLVIIPAEEFHHARTRNFAASIASGDFLVFLAADALPLGARWATALLSPFEDPDVGATYGRQVPKPGAGHERLNTLGVLYGTRRVVRGLADRDRLGYKYFFFSTVNACLRAEVWRAFPFPEESPVFEDIGIAKRILDAGRKIAYEPTATVQHSHDYGFIHLLRRYFDLGVALKRVDAWSRPSTSQSVWSDGGRILMARSKSLFTPEGLRASLGDAAKMVGISLGKHEARLPRWLKRRLSLFGQFG